MAIQPLVGQGVTHNRIFLSKCPRWSIRPGTCSRLTRAAWHRTKLRLLAGPTDRQEPGSEKPERIATLGLVLLLALLLWRLVERILGVHVETTGKPLTGWDKKIAQKPTT